MTYQGYNPLAAIEIVPDGDAAGMLENPELALETAASALTGSERLPVLYN